MTQIYVSVTGLKLSGIWHAPKFWRLAVPAMGAAQSAPGNLKASARTVAGVHHTLTAWESRDAMLAYVRAPAHLKAMRAFPGMATGKTLGFYSDTIPSWSEALAKWEAEARTYTGGGEIGRRSSSTNAKTAPSSSTAGTSGPPKPAPVSTATRLP